MSALDNLHKWGIVQTNTCVLSNRDAETHDHLFFQCGYASEVWTGVLNHLMAKNWTAKWTKILNWLTHNTGSNGAQSSIRTSFTSVLLQRYMVSSERVSRDYIKKLERTNKQQFMKSFCKSDTMSYHGKVW